MIDGFPDSWYCFCCRMLFAVEVLGLDTVVVYVVAHAAVALMVLIPLDTVVIDIVTDVVHVVLVMLIRI